MRYSKEPAIKESKQLIQNFTYDIKKLYYEEFWNLPFFMAFYRSGNAHLGFL